MVREAAATLGVDLTLHGEEYHLLHVVLALVSAPLPADWQEVLRGGKVLFLDGICPVRVSYEMDNENNCLNMIRKGVDMFRLGEWSC